LHDIPGMLHREAIQQSPVPMRVTGDIDLFIRMMTDDSLYADVRQL